MKLKKLNMMINKLLFSVLFLMYVSGCNQSSSDIEKKSDESELKKQNTQQTSKELEGVSKKKTLEEIMENAFERNFDKSNVIYESKVYQYPDSIRISGAKIQVWGHDKEVMLDISRTGLELNCKQKLEYKIVPLVCWDFQEPDFIIPSHCYKGDSLVLSSKPRVYRGDEPDAWIYDQKNLVTFKVDTEYFNDIFTFIQLSKETFLVFFDEGTQYGDKAYSFRYAYVKLER